jgi:hypothetical protein
MFEKLDTSDSHLEVIHKISTAKRQEKKSGKKVEK